MSSAVIKIENLWKEYRLGVIGHGTLTHDLQSWWARVRGKEDPNAKIAPMLAGQEKQIEGDHFWALRDINLEVKEGEILGIIGKNGAGKSTLLKILSRVTAPTRGNIKIKGRIASLLEVGTGFHPELTGRENIFMNGAILGMSKQEIKGKLDEIIDFSGVENFVDTPVKRYSSGMYVRLAFAVAAHLDPEILIIDEVLAVGDVQFQKKCSGKIGEVSKSGRTVLFVSHNINMIEQLCSKGIILKNGTNVYKSCKITDVISKYLSIDDHTKRRYSWTAENDKITSPLFSPQKAWLETHDGIIDSPVSKNSEVAVKISFNVIDIDSDLVVGIRIYERKTNTIVFITKHKDTAPSLWPEIKKGFNILSVVLPAHFLNEGKYLIELTCSIYCKYWIFKPQQYSVAICLDIIGGLSESPYWTSARIGFVAPVLQWKNLT